MSEDDLRELRKAADMQGLSREFAELEAENAALKLVLNRVANILRGSEDEDQGSAYDRAIKVLDGVLVELAAKEQR